MEEKQEVVVGAINQYAVSLILFILLICIGGSKTFAQDLPYKKRVLESTEVDLLMGYYEQEGSHAAVSGGIGDESLMDLSPSLVVSIPLSADEILKIDGTVSAYTSASSSNVNPFDGKNQADPFVASTGASSNDIWVNGTASYTHYSDDRNHINSLKMSVSAEFDYFSFGFGGSKSRLFNDKNTELGISANVYIDSWRAIYPYELRLFDDKGPGLTSSLFDSRTGAVYNPTFNRFSNEMRESFSLGFSFSQIISQRVQAALMTDLVLQEGLLSTPFQRVYFQDVPNSFVGDFHLAEDIERLPSQRKKIAIGGRLNVYLNEFMVLRSFARYYIDDWGIHSYTANIELPIKLGGSFTISPNYRYYQQSAADYFAPYDSHFSWEKYYTSDYDLSSFHAHQYGLGLKYTDILLSKRIAVFGLKSFEIKASHYQRNIDFKALIITTAAKFVLDT